MIGVRNLNDIRKVTNYWIYLKNGSRLPVCRQMTNYVGHPIVREIRFDNIYLAESGMHAVRQLVNKLSPAWQSAYSKLCMVKEAHENVSSGRKCLLYYFTEDHRPVLDFKWVGKPKKHWKNVEIGNQYFLIDAKMHKYQSLLGCAREVFKQALDRWCYKNHKLPYSDGVQKLTINGRDYYFKRTWPHRDKRHVDLEMLSAFGDKYSTYHELTLKGDNDGSD